MKKNTYEELKCPKCGSRKIAEDDCFDTESSYFNLYFIEYYNGHCKECKTELQWEVRYSFNGIYNFQEKNKKPIDN